MRYSIYLVGSTISGFGLDTSDVDMCLVSRCFSNLDARSEAMVHLSKLGEHLQQLSKQLRTQWNRIREDLKLLTHLQKKPFQHFPQPFSRNSIWFRRKCRFYALKMIFTKWKLIWTTIIALEFETRICCIATAEVSPRLPTLNLPSTIFTFYLNFFLVKLPSGLASSTVGVDCENLGPVPLHQ